MPHHGVASVSSIVAPAPTPHSPGLPPSTSVDLIFRRVPVRKGPIATIPPALGAKVNRTELPRNNSPSCQRSPAGYSRDDEERDGESFFMAIRQPRCDESRAGQKSVGDTDLTFSEDWEEDNQTVATHAPKTKMKPTA